MLIVQADGIPAKALRVAQINTKSPRFHVHDYARVEIASDGRLTAEPGEFTLSKGTRLAVLDVKVERDSVRLFTHTLAPILARDGRAAYGCTEFVFRFDPGALEFSEAGMVQSRIGQLLALAASR